MTPTILVTGGSGQVGQALLRHAPAGWECHAPGRTALDLTDADAIARMVASRPWTAVVNCAAYTAVDRAEAEVVTAWTVNALAPAALALATKAAGIPLLHISTDYVFDGAKADPYVEDDPIAPLGVYGASKEGGEQAVRTGNPAHVVLRTAWVVSAHGTNFVKTMLRLAAERPELRVVADQAGCPTGAADIARAIVTILKRLHDGTGRYGTFHAVNAGETTWAGLAAHVIDRAASRHGHPRPAICGIATSEYPTPARRPANSRLCCDKLVAAYAIAPRPWQDAVDEIVDELLGGGE